MIRIDPLERVRDRPDTPAELAGSQLPTLVVRSTDHPGLLWSLRLTEFFGDANGGFGYQPNAEWIDDGNGGLSYRDSPVSAVDGHAGTCSCAVSVGAESVRFELAVTNLSAEVWQDCWAWLCLIHRWAQAFQANCELPAGPPNSPWTPVNTLPAPLERWLKWCPVAAHEETASRIGTGSQRWQPHIRATAGAVRAWRIDGNEQQIIQLSSPAAVLLGWSHWPCTDMGLCFGDLAAGETGRVAGELRLVTSSFEPI